MSSLRVAEALAAVDSASLPPHVLSRASELFLDWLGCALAGKGDTTVERIRSGALRAYGTSGSADVVIDRTRSAPAIAALVNGAASHAVEQDDIHNSSIVHPATVVFPAALAAAQDLDCTGLDLLTAAIVGYEAATRVGAYLGATHYLNFHVTGTAGALGAAAAVAHLMGANTRQMLDALGNAGTTSAGLWQFLPDGADSKPLHAGNAAATGLTAAYMAGEGLRGADRILEGERGMGAAMSKSPRAEKLIDGLGENWAVCSTSIKLHASCRHTHPAVDALIRLMSAHGLHADSIESVEVGLYRSGYEVLRTVDRPTSVHQAKFSMGFVLALAAYRGHVSVRDFDSTSLADSVLWDFASRVRMDVDPEIDALHPVQWASKVRVETKDGRKVTERVDSPKGDPDNWPSDVDLDEKFLRLCQFQGAASAQEGRLLLEQARGLSGRQDVRGILPWSVPA